MSNIISFVIFLMAFGTTLIPQAAIGLDYPKREIEFIAAYAPGGNTDQFARVAAKFGEKYVGKPIIVVNRPGGGGARGFTALAMAKPDGYTIGLLSNSVIAQAYLLKGVTFDYKKSYRPIAQIDYSAMGLFVKKGSPYDVPLKELVKKAKDKPGTIKVGIGGSANTQDFARISFEEEADIKLHMIPFPGGGGDTVAPLLGGHIDMAIGPSAEWVPLLKGGKFSVLAVSTDNRDPRFPEIPTFKEFGYNVVIATFHWVAAPAGTPDDIINVLADAFKKGFAEQSFKDAADNLGATAAWESPQETMKAMERIDEIYRRIIKKYDLKPQ